MEWNQQLAHKNLDITRMPFDPSRTTWEGYSIGRQYAISDAAPHPTMVMFHEWAHILLGHTALTQTDFEEHRGVKEFQAEFTALITVNELGLLDDEATSASKRYIHNWLRSEMPPDIAIRDALVATHTIVQAGRLALDGI